MWTRSHLNCLIANHRREGAPKYRMARFKDRSNLPKSCFLVPSFTFMLHLFLIWHCRTRIHRSAPSCCCGTWHLRSTFSSSSIRTPKYWNVLRTLHLEHKGTEHEAAISYFGLLCGTLGVRILDSLRSSTPDTRQDPHLDPLSSPEPCQPCSNPLLNSWLL